MRIPQPASKIFHKYDIVFILVLALLLRLPLLSGSLWLDEAAQALESFRPLILQLQIAEDFQPPFFHLVVHFLSRVSHQEWWLRSGSLIAGLITIFATILTVKRLFGHKTALVTGLLLASSSLHVFFSQELRPYSFAAMWLSLSWWELAQLAEAKKTTWSNFSLYFLYTSAGLYTTYLYPFGLLGQVCFILFMKKTLPWKSLFVSLGLSSLCFAPWLPYLLEQLQVSAGLRVSVPTWEFVVSTPQAKALPLLFGKFLYGVSDLELSWQYVFLTLFFGGLTLYLLSKTKLTKTQSALLVSWLIIPIFSAWLFSFFIPVLQAKRVLFSLPAFYLLIAVALEQSWGKETIRKLSLGLMILAALINTYSLHGYYTNPRYQREDWRSLIKKIDTDFSTQSAILVFGFNHPFTPWNFYPHQPFQFIATGTRTVTAVDQIDEQMKPALEYEQVLVFDYLRDITDPNHSIDQWLKQYNYHQTQLLDSPNIGFVRVYTKGQVFAVKPL